MEKYKMTEQARKAWKKSAGSLTGKIPYGEDGETLSEYVNRKWEGERGNRNFLIGLSG